jgi:transposase-like protein
MGAPRKYPEEVRERAVRLVHDLVENEDGMSINAACRRVGEQLGINMDTLRNWVKQARNCHYGARLCRSTFASAACLGSRQVPGSMFWLCRKKFSGS